MVCVGGVGDQLPSFDAESKSAKIPNSLCGRGRGRGSWGVGGLVMANFQNQLSKPKYKPNF